MCVDMAVGADGHAVLLLGRHALPACAALRRSAHGECRVPAGEPEAERQALTSQSEPSSVSAQVRLRALDEADIGRIHRLVVVPAVSILAIAIIVPPMLLSMPWTLAADEDTARLLAVLARMAHLATAVGLASFWLAYSAVRWLSNLAQTIRDDRYLIGRRLRNIDEVAAAPDNPAGSESPAALLQAAPA